VFRRLAAVEMELQNLVSILTILLTIIHTATPQARSLLGSLHKEREEDSIFCVIKDGIFFLLLLFKESDTDYSILTSAKRIRIKKNPYVSVTR
jgi:hypothetical protein